MIDYRPEAIEEYRQYLRDVWFGDAAPDRDTNHDGRTYNDFTGENVTQWKRSRPAELGAAILRQPSAQRGKMETARGLQTVARFSPLFHLRVLPQGQRRCHRPGWQAHRMLSLSDRLDRMARNECLSWVEFLLERPAQSHYCCRAMLAGCAADAARVCRGRSPHAQVPKCHDGLELVFFWRRSERQVRRAGRYRTSAGTADGAFGGRNSSLALLAAVSQPAPETKAAIGLLAQFSQYALQDLSCQFGAAEGRGRAVIAGLDGLLLSHVHPSKNGLRLHRRRLERSPDSL